MAHMLMGSELQQEKRPEYSYGRRVAAAAAPVQRMQRFDTAPEPLQDPQQLYAPPQQTRPPPMLRQHASPSMQDVWDAGCRHGAAEQQLQQHHFPTLGDLPPQQPMPFHAASAAAAGRAAPPLPYWQQDAGQAKAHALSHPPSGSPGRGLRNHSTESDSTWVPGVSPSVRVLFSMQGRGLKCPRGRMQESTRSYWQHGQCPVASAFPVEQA
jgi:hypothetical protein